jgi:hypothetical protein
MSLSGSVLASSRLRRQVATDGGSVAAHASLVARDLGHGAVSLFVRPGCAVGFGQTWGEDSHKLCRGRRPHLGPGVGQMVLHDGV